MIIFTEWMAWKQFQPIIRQITSVLSEAAWPEEWASKYFSDPQFVQWLKSHGVTEPLGKPMEGGIGRAYPSGDFIIKFTPDSKEADAAAVMKGYDSPNAAKVYDVMRLGRVEDRFDKPQYMFAIIQEKLNTDVSKKHRVAGQALYDYLDRNAGFIRGEVDQILPVVLSYLPKKYQKDDAISKLVQQMLTSVKKIQDERGFLTQDPHGGNVALKGRQPAFFDYGRSSIDFDNPATHSARVGALS